MADTKFKFGAISFTILIAKVLKIINNTLKTLILIQTTLKNII